MINSEPENSLSFGSEQSEGNMSKAPFTGISKETADKLCEEIETQWYCHLMTRAVFTSDFPLEQEYESTSFYSARGFDFCVKINNMESEGFLKAKDRMGKWLNQNFVIRLFGILDHKKLMDRGFRKKNELLELIYILRHKVGAHSTGRNPYRKKDGRKGAQLIEKLFDRRLDQKSVEDFNLAVDTVLEPMKDRTIQFVRSIEMGGSS